MVYYFSGSLTEEMVEMLTNVPGYEPIDVLVSQLDRNAIKGMIKRQSDGIIRQLFIDSGAFSVHTGKATVDCDEYISYLNSIDEHIHLIAQLDTIPGNFGQSKSKEDYENSAKLSWENFLYMYPKLKSPEKLMPVFHYGESFDALKNMLEWEDETGRRLSYVGISPANDTGQNIKNRYMENVYDFIAKSSNPDIKSHLYGMTSLDGLARVPAYSADSISHRLISGYNKILHPKYGVISLSQRTRTSKTKSNQSFVDTADEVALKEVADYIEELGLTLEQAMESSSARVVITMVSIQRMIKANPFGSKQPKKPMRLF